ncbi:hypothetical protein [Streptomyces sp. NBC_00268]|uniref:hypothetical protein n=1 Tax=Streptomyces sp. NBC_00268 TaxID=2975695 RepID=UPI0022502678|nr:hypothetical protein [Streptomyces sp. NBC_00268]MCX5192277.1 hypothetical protein [Streptomyces sp. NBC_00268]
MTVDVRPDPVQIVAKVGSSFMAADPERAFEVWVYLASKAGWQVSPVEDVSVDLSAGECGVVEIEGLRYLVRQSRRVRRTLVDDVTGGPAERPVFGFAAWAEPVLSPENVDS